jgi:hypothetical protein
MNHWLREMLGGIVVVIMTAAALMLIFQVRFPMHQIYFH